MRPRCRRMKGQMVKLRPEKKPAPPTITRVLPMHLQVGDRLADETGEWQVIGRPYTTSAGKDAHVRVKKVDQGRPRACQRAARMTVSAYLQAFIHNHHPHGLLTGDPTEPAWNGYLLTVACPCGVVFGRWVTPEEADADLLRLAALNRGAGRIIRPTMRPQAFLSPVWIVTASATRWALKGLARFASGKV